MRIHFIHKFKYKPVKIHLFWRHLQLDVIFANKKSSVYQRIGSVLYKQCEYYLILNNYSFYRQFQLIGFFFYEIRNNSTKRLAFFISLQQTTNISNNMMLMSVRKSRLDESLKQYIYNIRTLSVNIKFICTSFRNRQNSEPSAGFSGLFRSEYK